MGGACVVGGQLGDPRPRSVKPYEGGTNRGTPALRSVRIQHKVEVQAIGAGAINQAIKAIAISRGYVAPGGLDLVCIPSFINISIDGEERTGISLVVEVR
jgi:stage V sporulation protein S